MKILVIDDNPIHRQSAIQTLGSEHKVTIVTSVSEGYKALGTYAYCNKWFSEELKEILREQGLPTDYKEAQDKLGKDGYKTWLKTIDDIGKSLYWDVVLCDLLMPAEVCEAGMDAEGKKHLGQDMPLGWALAIKAVQGGAKFVAVVTDKNHHSHPASAMLDGIGEVMHLNDAKILFTNNPDFIPIIGTEQACDTCGGTGKEIMSDGTRGSRCWPCRSTGTFVERGKDWADILRRLREGE